MHLHSETLMKKMEIQPFDQILRKAEAGKKGEARITPNLFSQTFLVYLRIHCLTHHSVATHRHPSKRIMSAQSARHVTADPYRRPRRERYEVQEAAAAHFS